MTVGIDSWVTLSEANNYFVNKWGASAWAPLIILQKEQLLISAYRWMKSISGLSIADSSTDPKVKNAQIELSWYIYNFSEDHFKHQALDAQGVKSFSIMSYSETLQGAQFPQYILDTLDAFVTNSGGKIITVHRDFT
jgi:hypothetical protein